MAKVELHQRAVNDATSQLDRQLGGPKPELGAVDSRSFAQLLSFAADYGALLRFYDLADQIEGDWRVFFTADPTQVRAGIVAIDLDRLEQLFAAGYARAATSVSVTDRIEGLAQLVELLLAVARRIDGWLLGAATSEDELLRARLSEVIDGELGQRIRELQALVSTASRAGLSWPREFGFDGLSARWRIRQASVGEAAFAGRNWIERIDSALAIPQAAWNAMSEQLAVLWVDAEAELEGSLVGGQHHPQLALWISFAKLFRRAQAASNGIAERFVEFYYRDVLRTAEARAEPDEAYLVLALAESEQPQIDWVAAGTEFSADGPDGQSLVYQAVDSLCVSSAALARVRTLRVARTCLGASSDPTEPNCSPALLVPTTVSESVIDLEALASGNRGFATFGRNVGADERPDPVEATLLAGLGLLLASPELALAGGRRTVTLGFGFDDVQLDVRGANGFGSILAERIDAIRISGSDDAIFRAVLERAYRVRVSTADGWVAVPSYTVSSCLFVGLWTLEFTLPASFPGITSLSEQLDADRDDPEARMPCVVLDLVQERVGPTNPGPIFNPVHPLSLLGGMPLTRVEVHVSVEQMAPERIANPDGEIDPSVPFSVFGAAPVVGAYLRLGCAEVFAKQITSLTLTIDWYDLPRGAEGFFGYYSGYSSCPREFGQTHCFDNCVFEVQLLLGEADGLWVLPPNDVYALFRGETVVEPPSVPSCDGTVAALAIGPLCNLSVFVPGIEANEQSSRFQVPEDNYLELRLVGPSYAFGDSIYAANVLAAVVAYLPDGISCAAKCEARYLALQQAAALAKQCSSNPSGGPCPCFELVRSMLVTARDACRASGCEGCGPCDVFDRAIAAVDACLAAGECSGPSCESLSTTLDGLHRESISACMVACTTPAKPLDYPNAPYQPQATAVRLRYESGGPLIGELQHLLPFGGRQTLAGPSSGLVPSLLPEWGFDGAMYLGFSALARNTPLTLLFRMAAAVDHQPSKIRWSALGVDRGGQPTWTPIETGADGTHDLHDTGILELRSVGAELGQARGFSDDLHWLRATVAGAPERFPNTLAITPHALVVRDRGSVDDPRDCYHRLAAHAITTSVQSLDLVASIDQPLPSFGGYPAETPATWRLRTSERLRHKSRAIQAWDQERLVLERHPWVWKVRVLQAHDLGRSRRPGAVLVVVIPKLEEAVVEDRREPRASAEQLLAVRETLTRRASVFAQIHVVNPNYRGLEVTTRVAFVVGENPILLRERLDTELQAYLSPGLFDVERELIGGDYVEDDMIEAFVQSRSYVQYVESLTTTRAGEGFDPTLDWCFLTSARSHNIVPVEGPRCREDSWSNR